jgi:hypothetical protein
MEDVMKILTAFFALILIAGCVTPPTKEEIANLDYGSCPNTHLEKIKSHFQSGLLTAYEGEPVVWPPRKFWYQSVDHSSPLDLGKLYAGYLVPVMANKTRGLTDTQFPVGEQIYGFLFKNDELVKLISPVTMAQLTISEQFGPLPTDKRDWKIGNSGGKGNQSIVEWVIQGESVQNWSELITLQTFAHVPLKITPEYLAKGAESSFKKRCARVTQTTLFTTRTEIIVERAASECAPSRDEYAIEKYIRGPYTIHHVAYAKTVPLNDTERQKWTALIKRATIFGDCK